MPPPLTRDAQTQLQFDTIKSYLVSSESFDEFYESALNIHDDPDLICALFETSMQDLWIESVSQHE